MENNILMFKTTKNIIETKIEEENVGHGKDLHLLLVALTRM